MSTPDFALRHYLRRAGLTRTVADALAELWRGVDPSDISRSWLERLPEAVTALTAGQLAAAQQAEAYAAAGAAAEGLSGAAEGLLAAAAFAGVAADGRGLLTLLAQPVFTALSALKAGKPVAVAMDAAADQLDRIARTEVADAGRAADQVAITARPQLEGYIRVLVGETCARCIILAGRWYPYSEGFRRHDRCDCVHLPASQARAEDLIQDPHEMYDRMTPAQRLEAGWSQHDQDAIALGADLFQVTNAKRSTYIAGKLEFTREGTTVRGLFGGYYIEPETGHLRRRANDELTKRPRQRVRSARERRLTPNQIMTSARDREHAIQMLRRYGYLLGVANERVEPEPTLEPDVATESEDRPSDLARIIATPIVDIRQLGGGMMGETDLITYEGGRAIRKTFERGKDTRDVIEQADAEQLSVLVVRAVGVRAPAVLRTRTDEVHMEFISGKTPAEMLQGDWDTNPATLVNDDQRILLGLADALTVNSDRNSGNYILDDDGNVWAIDHGMAFQDGPSVLDAGLLGGSKFASHFVSEGVGDGGFGDGWAPSNDVSQADMLTVRGRLLDLRDAFDRAGRLDWWEAMMERMDILQFAASGTRVRL